MTTNKEPGKAHSARGFSGLASMVSDVDALVANPVKPKSDQSPANRDAGSASHSLEGQSAREPTSNNQPFEGSVNQPSGTFPLRKVLLGVGGVIGILWLLSSMNTPSSSGRSQPTPPVNTNSLDQTDRHFSRFTEEVPPVGTKLVLGPAQIRYCLSEGIRIDAARGVLDRYSQWDVDRFNAMITDYNSRCSDFRYRSGSVESARAEV